MSLIRLFDALAPTGSRGRHEAAWRPLPPAPAGRRRRPAPTMQSAPLFGAVTTISLIGSMVAVAAPTDADHELLVTPEPVAVTEDPAFVVDTDVEFVLPEPTPSTFVVDSTIADPEFEIARRSTTTTTTAPPTPEEAAEAAALEEQMQRSAETMTAVGFEDDVTSSVTVLPAVVPPPETPEECRDRARAVDLVVDGTWDRNALAQMTWSLFDCVLTLAGFDEVAPTRSRAWDGATRWGFEHLAEQMAAEAVVVAYCESIGFQHRAIAGSNGFGYAGLFQMGSVEMRRWGTGGDRYDPVDNAFGAANYVVHQYRNGDGWGGWSPWAVVNTNFDDEVNDRVKVPVLPRFRSNDPAYRGQRGAELPEWAVNPWTADVPSWNGCPTTGGRW